MRVTSPGSLFFLFFGPILVRSDPLIDYLIVQGCSVGVFRDGVLAPGQSWDGGASLGHDARRIERLPRYYLQAKSRRSPLLLDQPVISLNNPSLPYAVESL